jgi:hypothetical protein
MVVVILLCSSYLKPQWHHFNNGMAIVVSGAMWRGLIVASFYHFALIRLSRCSMIHVQR